MTSQLNELSKANEKAAKHKPITSSKSRKKHPHNEKKTTHKIKTHRTSMKMPISVSKDEKSTTSINTNKKTLIANSKNDRLWNKAIKTKESTITANEGNNRAKVNGEHETDDNMLKDTNTDDGSNNLKKKVDTEYSNTKSFNYNANDKQYSKGYIMTQWTTVTKAFDNKSITQNVDAVVKYVSVSNDDRRFSGKKEYSNEIITNALKAILEKIDGERKMKANTEKTNFDGRYEIDNDVQNHKTTFEKEDEHKRTVGVGDDAELNCDKRLSVEKRNEMTAEETERNTDVDEDSDSDLDYEPTQTATENDPLATYQNKARQSARNKKHDGIQTYPYTLYRSYEKQNTMRDDRFLENNNKMSISEEITTNRLEKNQHTPSFEEALYKKLKENELNAKLKNNNENVADKLHDYFNDLVIWNGDVLNRETDIVSNFMKNLKADKRNLDSLKKEVEDIGIYLENSTLPNKVYTLSGMKYTTLKPVLKTYQRAAEELMLKDDDDRLSFNNAVKAHQSGKNNCKKEVL